MYEVLDCDVLVFLGILLDCDVLVFLGILFDCDVLVFLGILKHAHVIADLLKHYRKVTAMVLGQYASRVGQHHHRSQLHYCKQLSKEAFCV